MRIKTFLLFAVLTISTVSAMAAAPDNTAEILQRRSQFTNGGVAMVVCIGAMLVFLVVNNRWQHRLEVKNLQLQRERNVVVAQNKQLAIERDRATAALQAKTSFLQSMTHEVRTPLNAISGFAQVLATTGVEIPEADRRDLSLSIQENTRLLTNILNDMILISDTESGSELPAAEQCIVSALIEEATESIRPRIAPGVTLESKCSIPNDEIITTQPQLISLILHKLLDNAAKFTKSGSIVSSLDRDDVNLHFSVADTGPGIPKDKREYVFERFAKLDNFIQGAGLGLSLAHMVAERLGGSLTIDAEYNKGTKFDLIIPINIKA